MPTKTVESYEKRMNDEMMKTLRLSPEYLAELGVTLEKLQSFDSISDLTTLDAISIPLMDSLIIRGVSALMQDYIFHHDDNIQTVHGRMFRCGEHSGQKDKARIILIACDIAESEQNHGISRIKDGLESGLFAENLHPLDEFPKLVNAIVNQTVGLENWEFSERVIEQLNQRQEIKEESPPRQS